MNIPVRTPQINRWSECDAPEWSISPSPFDWQVMIYGGDNPRTGFPQPPLVFQFFGPHYSRVQIMQRAADMCEREHRASFQVREPSNPQFRKASAPSVMKLAAGMIDQMKGERK